MRPTVEPLYQFALALPEDERRKSANALVAVSGYPPAPTLPTVPPGGWLPDDELTQEWLRAVQDYRDQCDKADRDRLSNDSDDGKVA